MTFSIVARSADGERWGVAAPDFGFLLALQACPKARLARFLQSNTLGMAG